MWWCGRSGGRGRTGPDTTACTAWDLLQGVGTMDIGRTSDPQSSASATSSVNWILPSTKSRTTPGSDIVGERRIIPFEGTRRAGWALGMRPYALVGLLSGLPLTVFAFLVGRGRPAHQRVS